MVDRLGVFCREIVATCSCVARYVRAMNNPAIALASILLSACTTSTPASEKSAAAITYDNASSHLVSTTVQDAIDDLAAAGSTLQDRVDGLAAARPVIWCDYRSASLVLGDSQLSFAHVFTTSDCGGALPDAHYVGALSRMTSCSTSVNAITVSNFGEPDGPGVTMRRTGTAACSGPAELAAVFYFAN
jgi:hypothetical protein